MIAEDGRKYYLLVHTTILYATGSEGNAEARSEHLLNATKKESQWELFDNTTEVLNEWEKLETIHDKLMHIFLPEPDQIDTVLTGTHNWV